MLKKLETEIQNDKTKRIDEMEIIEIIKIMNEEDATIPLSVREILPEIEKTIEFCINSYNKGGRIIYAGAGTSGRIAVIDAAEVIPTFGIDDNVFVSILAGGKDAFVKALESVEDVEDEGIKTIFDLNVTENDTVIGVAASGRTPFVKGILEKSKENGAKTALLCNVKNPLLKNIPDVVISASTGPEVLTGSTRLKAGTAQKMILNMISTITMIKVGRVFSNYMIGVKILNEKLMDRATRIVSEITGETYEDSRDFINKSENNVPLAILMALSGEEKEKCQKALIQEKGNLKKALNNLQML
jgi:N-acetylmuramic acid 6-phosphate etherase